MVRRIAAFLALLLMPMAAMSQQSQLLDSGIVRSPMLIIEFDRVFAESLYGQRVSGEIEAEGAAIAAENRAIETELQTEERQLTEQRPGMDSAAFRALANAFDSKVQRLRDEQDAKARALSLRTEEARRDFLKLLRPTLEEIMRDAGAAAILDRRAVFLSNNAIDITDTAIERVNQKFGDGLGQNPVDP